MCTFGTMRAQSFGILWLVIACCHASRELAVGDFDALNDLLVGATIKLPNARVETNVISVDMTNLRCTNFRLDDVTLNTFRGDGGETKLFLNVDGLDFNCFLDYRYTFLFTRSGTAELYSYDNRATISMLFESPNYSQGTFHPTRSSIDQCIPEASVNDMAFRGSIAAIVLDVVEGLLRDKVEEEAERWICEELQSMSQTIVTDTLKEVDKTMAKYISAPAPDPLRSEDELFVPDNITIVDFQEKESWKKWLDQMLVDGVAFLTKEVYDDNGESDMNINVLIRSFLDDDGSFLLDSGEGFLLYEGHDKFLQSSILLDSIRVVGLDTLTKFEPLVDVGKHTLQNEFAFRYLSVEMDIILKMKPSTRTDSIFVNADGSGITSGGDSITEKVTIKFGLEDINAVASVLLAVDEAKLGSVSLGALLDTENIFDCFLSTLFLVQVPSLSVSAGNVQPPTLEGFVSPGIDRIVTNAVDAAYHMYNVTMLEAAPGFFQIAATKFLNKKFGEIFPMNDFVSSKCNPPAFDSSGNGFVDFRDLLLTPDESLEYGGSGTQPYGDVVYTLVSEVKEQFLANDADGSPKVNSMIRDFLAAKSSNVSGSAVVYADDVLNTTTSVGMGGFRADLGFRIYGARVFNLDTLKSPVQFLEPVYGEAHMLNNSVSIGVVSKPVRLSAKILITVNDNAELNLRNEIGVSLDLTSAYIGLIILLQVLEQPFFAVPLRDTLNLNCWLTTILPSSPDSTGIVLKQHTTSVEDLFLSIGCVDCSSPDFDALIDMLYAEKTKDKVSNFMDLVLESDYLRIATDGFVSTASKQCPHTPEYDENASWGDFVKDAFGGFGVVGATRDEKAKYFNIALAAITAGLLFIFFVVRWIARRRNRSLMDSLSSQAICRLRLKEEEERDKQNELNVMTRSMFHSPQLPRYVRLTVPLVILLTIGLVLVGHLGVLSTVNVVGQFAGESFAVSDVLEFSFFSAALRTYNNGGVEVAILLFLFTTVWLTKLCMSLVLFFLPPQKLSVKRRGTILLWLDVFAKLSIPDIFMMLLLVGALMVFIGGADETLVMEGDFFSAKVIVVPGAGFYCIIMGQRITRVLSRYLLDCHQEIVKAATRTLKLSDEWVMRASGRTTETWPMEDDEESRVSDSVRSTSEQFDDEESRVWESVRNTSHNGSDSMSDASGTENGDSTIETETRQEEESSSSIKRPVAVIFIAITVVILIVIACVYVPAISIDTKVIWGLLATGKTFEEAVKDYGMFWMISRILVQSRFVLDSVEDYVGLGFLLALVIVTSLASPTMKAIALLRRWHQQRQRRPRQAPPSRNVKVREHSSVPLRTKVLGALRRWMQGSKHFEEDSYLLPACRLQAWQDLEVYILAFVVACWQLGAVAGYAIHIYCFILEKVYDIVVYLGLMERTTPQCYRVQTSSPIFVVIVLASFVVLLMSFFFQASSQYRKTMDKTAKEMKGIDCEDEEDKYQDTSHLTKSETKASVQMEPEELSSGTDPPEDNYSMQSF